MMNRWWTWAALGCVAVSSATSARAQETTAPRAVLSIVDGDGEAPASAVETEVRAISSDLDGLVAFYDAERTAGKFWIGVSCEPVSESLRNQLDLEAEVGLLVNEVMDDSPAKAAGVQPHDVLISAAFKSDDSAEERKLTEIGDLSTVVQKAETKPLSLVLLRKGKPQTLSIAPVERPQPQNFLVEFTDVDVVKPHQGDPKKVQILLQQLQQELGGAPQMLRLQSAAPVVVAAPPQVAHFGSTYAFAGNGLPEGMTLTITKSGNNPARIEVKKGEGQVWGANENEIETLPAEAQAIARSALAGMSQPNFTIAVSPPKHGAGGNVRFTHPQPGKPMPPGWSGMSPYAPTLPPAVPQPPHAEFARQLAERHLQLVEEQARKGDEHPDVRQIKAQIDALQQELAAKTKATAAQNAYRSTVTRRTTEAQPVIRPPQPA
ncbi:MAG TPA: PDZ domain-containing protein, partial [Planctomycetaceae bacterium]|nr:PDZ domain-containing protein [Planctomycetaceae bacterium]